MIVCVRQAATRSRTGSIADGHSNGSNKEKTAEQHDQHKEVKERFQLIYERVLEGIATEVSTDE